MWGFCDIYWLNSGDLYLICIQKIVLLEVDKLQNIFLACTYSSSVFTQKSGMNLDSEHLSCISCQFYLSVPMEVLYMLVSVANSLLCWQVLASVKICLCWLLCAVCVQNVYMWQYFWKSVSVKCFWWLLLLWFHVTVLVWWLKLHSVHCSSIGHGQ